MAARVKIVCFQNIQNVLSEKSTVEVSVNHTLKLVF